MLALNVSTKVIVIPFKINKPAKPRLSHYVEPLQKDHDLTEISNDLAEVLSTIACALDMLAQFNMLEC